MVTPKRWVDCYNLIGDALMSEINNPRDMFSREILIGDECVYPVRRGSKMWMNRFTVTCFTVSDGAKATLVGTKQDGYPVRIKALDRVAIIGRDGVIPFTSNISETE